MWYEIMLTCSEVFLNSCGHILDSHCLRMYNLRTQHKMTSLVLSRVFKGADLYPLQSSVSSKANSELLDTPLQSYKPHRFLMALSTWDGGAWWHTSRRIGPFLPMLR